MNNLEPSQQERRLLQDAIGRYAENFLEKNPELQAYIAEGYDKKEGDHFFEIDGQQYSIEELLQFIGDRVDKPGLNPASGGHLGYIPGGGIYTSALGDYLADVTNRYAGVFYASPGAVRMENALIDWVGREVIGFKKGFGGNITSGGSMANVIALSTAKIARNIKSRDLENMVIYTTSQSHHSIQKAIRLTGMDECIIRLIETDNHFRIDTDILKRQIEIDRGSRLQPFMIIANAGSTDVGAIDDLESLAQISSFEGMWLHVDGAYGGFFLLTEEGREKLKGIEKADSVILDPHKGMFLPYGTGMVLVKNMKDLMKANDYQASYMQDADAWHDEISPADVSPELSRNFRGMRMWLPLKLHGIQPFVDALNEKLELTRYFCEEVQKLGFKLGNQPDLSVAIYRYKAKDEKTTEQINRQILDLIHQDGTVFISSTNVNKKFWLRIAILSFRTHKREIDQLLALLKKGVELYA